MVDIKKGLLDEKRLPKVTNGTWSLRVKIADPDKEIPSYIIRRDEGELWSLNFEGRRFVCWKCGSSNHIGDKCREQSRTFEEVFGGTGDGGNTGDSDNEFVPPTWAAIVRGDIGESNEQKTTREQLEKKIKEDNLRRDRDRREAEDRRKEAEQEEERIRIQREVERLRAIEEVSIMASREKEIAEQVNTENMEDDDDDELLAAAQLPNTGALEAVGAGDMGGAVPPVMSQVIDILPWF